MTSLYKDVSTERCRKISCATVTFEFPHINRYPARWAWGLDSKPLSLYPWWRLGPETNDACTVQLDSGGFGIRFRSSCTSFPSSFFSPVDRRSSIALLCTLSPIASSSSYSHALVSSSDQELYASSACFVMERWVQCQDRTRSLNC